MALTAPAIVAYLRDTFTGLDVVEAMDTHFVFYDPQADTPPDRRQPFVTVVTSDAHDTASNLSRPGAFRVNVGVGRETYRRLFGPEPAWNLDGGPVATGHDFAAVDVILPHPVYAPLSWVCALNPGDATWERLKPMIAEAYAIARRQHERRRAGSG